MDLTSSYHAVFLQFLNLLYLFKSIYLITFKQIFRQENDIHKIITYF